MQQRIKLNADAIRKIEAIEHVAAVVPNVRMTGKAILDGKSEDVRASSVAPGTASSATA